MCCIESVLFQLSGRKSSADLHFLHKLIKLKEIERDHLDQLDRPIRRDTGSWSGQTGKGKEPHQSISLSLMFCRLDFLYILFSHLGVFFVFFLLLIGCGLGWFTYCIFVKCKNAMQMSLFVIFFRGVSNKMYKSWSAHKQQIIEVSCVSLCSK